MSAESVIDRAVPCYDTHKVMLSSSGALSKKNSVWIRNPLYPRLVQHAWQERQYASLTTLFSPSLLNTGGGSSELLLLATEFPFGR